jgi:uncharacterized protein
MFEFLRLGPIVALSFLLTSCATFERSYPSKLENTKVDLKNNHIDLALKSYDYEFNSGDDSNLNLLTIGRLSQLDGKSKLSLSKYAMAIQAIRSERDKAKIQLSKILSNSAAIVTSDVELPYSTPSYEQVFLYAYQAQNYMSLGDIPNALVSIRRLSQAQAWVKMQRDIANASIKKIKTDQSNIALSKDLSLSNSRQIRSMRMQVKNISNSYENAFAYYLESILYEANDFDYNDSYISIKNALRLVNDNQYVKDTYQQMKFGFNGDSPFKRNQGRIVVFYESSLVDVKKSVSIPIFLGNLGVQNISIPYYSNNQEYIHAANIRVKDKNGIILQGKTALLVDTNLLAKKSLSEQYTAIVTREILRLIFKSTATYQLQKEAGITGLLVGSVYSVLTSRADLRSWLLLPENIQLYQSLISKGAYTLFIDNRKYRFLVKPNRTTLIWVTRIGSFVHSNIYQL